MTSLESLNPDLWSKLPLDMVDIIIYKVLIDLPFSEIHRFCVFCKRWRDCLLSSANYLLHLRMGKLKAFNSRRGGWEIISLHFCQDQVDGLRVKNLRLLCSAGGLLCLSNMANGEYIVCNPLTKCCKRLGKHRWRVPRNFRVPAHDLAVELGTRIVASSTWRWEDYCTTDQAFSIYHWKIKGDIQLTLTCDKFQMTGQRRTIVHDYRRTTWPTWEVVIGVGTDFHFYVGGPLMLSDNSLALGFHRPIHSPSFNVLVYDLKLRKCGWITTERIPLSNGKQVVGIIDDAQQFRFEEVRDTGLTSAFPPPLRIAFEQLMDRMSEGLRAAVSARKHFQMFYVEQDDVGYLLAMVADSQLEPCDVVAVWRHCRVDNSDVISECKEDWTWLLDQCWPLRTAVHVFKPSFACESCRHQGHMEPRC